MNKRQLEKFKELMTIPVGERIEMARFAEGEMQVILSYDPKPEVIDALLENQRINTRLLINMVERKSLNESHLRQIAFHHEWSANYDVKFALIRNPRTPAQISLKFLRYMYRKELQAVSRDVAIPNTVRYTALKKLENQLVDMPVGEKLVLAREAIGPLLTLLLHDSDKRVVQTVLNNPRLKESELIVMVNKRNLQEHFIRAIFESSWIIRYPIKVALANNINTPYEICVEIIPGLLQQDLQGLIKNTRLSVPTRVMARNMLKMKILKLTRKQHLRLACECSREIINILIEKDDLSIIKSLERNPVLLEGQMVSLAVNTKSRSILEYLLQDSIWRDNPKVREAVRNNLRVMEENEAITSREE